MNSLYDSKTNSVFIGGALMCLAFFILFSIPAATALTWNIDHTTVISNSTEFWITNLGSLGDVNVSQFRADEPGKTLSINHSWLDDLYVNIDGDTMTGDLDMGTNNIINVGNLEVNNNISVGGQINVTENIYFGGNILPQITNGNDIGSEDLQIGSIYIAGNIQSHGAYIEEAKVGVALIDKGAIVYIINASGNKPTVGLADNTIHDGSHIYGMAIETATLGQTVHIAILGEVSGLDTSMFSEGDLLHLIANGSYQTAIPSNGSHIHVGWVTRSNAGAGIIKILTDQYVHDIQGTTDSNVSLGGNKIEFQNYSQSNIGFMDMTSNIFSWDGDLNIIKEDAIIRMGPNTEMVFRHTGIGGSFQNNVGHFYITNTATLKDIQFNTKRDIVFAIDSDVKMIVDTTGDVGIGTTTPTAKLQMGDSTIGEQSSIFGAAAVDGLLVSPGTTIGTFFIEGLSTADIMLSASAGAVDEKIMLMRNNGGKTIFSSTNDAFSAFISENILVLDHVTGDVGLGTINPTGKLDVAGDIKLSSNVAWYTDTSNGRITRMSDHGLAIVGTTGTQNDLGIFTPAGQPLISNPTGTNNLILIKNSNGYVGIGQPSPSAKLEILQASDSAAEGIHLSRTGAETGALWVDLTTNTFNIGRQLIGNYAISIDSNENVGIKTKTPSEALEVSGNISITTDNDKLLFGTGKDMSIYYNGTNGNIKTDEIIASDLYISCGANKTLVLDEAVYDDINSPFDIAKVPAANNPTWSSFQGNLNAYTFSVNDFLEITSELFHKYKEGTDLDFHIHWVTNGLDGTDRTVKWEIEYTIANMDSSDGVGDAFPSTTIVTAEATIPANTPDLTHMYTPITTVNGTGLKVGAYTKARVRRVSSTGTEPSNDPFGFALGMHYEVDTMGSRLLADK